MVAARFEIFLVDLEPARGGEIKKTRPCVVISPDEANRQLATVIIAPMTTGSHPYPTRIAVTFKRKRGYVVLDQIRTVDRTRLVKKLGTIDAEAARSVLSSLQSLFAP